MQRESKESSKLMKKTADLEHQKKFIPKLYVFIQWRYPLRGNHVRIER